MVPEDRHLKQATKTVRFLELDDEYPGIVLSDVAKLR